MKHDERTREPARHDLPLASLARAVGVLGFPVAAMSSSRFNHFPTLPCQELHHAEREKQLFQLFPLSTMPTQTITAPNINQTPPANDIFDAVFEKSLNFRIELPFEEAQEFIRRIDRYNEFDASLVLDGLQRIDGLLPRMQYSPGNPNNGRRDYKISVGREGSPVIYLDRWEVFDKPELDSATMKAICREMELIALADESHYHIDQFTRVPGRKIEFRFWWD